MKDFAVLPCSSTVSRQLNDDGVVPARVGAVNEGKDHCPHKEVLQAETYSPAEGGAAFFLKKACSHFNGQI